MGAKHANREKDIETRALQEAPQRIGCFLLGLCDKNAEGATTIHLPYEKTVIAEQLGIRPETFSRALVKLQKDLGLKIKGAEIAVGDIEQLADYTCMACSHRFPCHKITGEK